MKAYSGSKKSRSTWIKPVLALLLWLACLVTAIAVVYSTWQSRKATQELEELRRKENGLQVISGQLLLEKSSWAAYSRVEEVAEKELNMRVAEPDKTVLVYR